MRLGLIGPAEGDVAGLAKAAEFLLNTARVERAVYLGSDAAIDDVVSIWARSFVGGNPTDDGVWERAAQLAIAGTPKEIESFVRGERARQRLRALEALAPNARSVELLGDRLAILIHDKALLSEEDILPANLLVYGKGELPLARRIGSRWFVTPGQISDAGGVGVLDDAVEDEVTLSVFDPMGKAVWQESMSMMRSAKFRVQGTGQGGS